MAVGLRKSSPYFDTPINLFYRDFLSFREITHSDDDDLIVIEDKYVERPDVLSFDLYGTTRYWWVFMIRNMDIIKDPIFDMQAGTEIFVPKKDTLEREVG